MDFKDNSNNFINSKEYIDDYVNEDDAVESSKENKFIKGIIDRSLDKKSLKFSKSVDVRIVLTDLNYIESISSTLNNFDLSNFNIVISSLIPTNEIEIAKSTTHNADLLLVATEFSEEGKKLFYQFKKALKNDFNHIEYLKLPDLSSDSNYHPYNNYDSKINFTEFFEDEIANSIIRAGLSCVSNLSLINTSKLNFFKIKEDYDNANQKLDKFTTENEHLNNEIKVLRDKNQNLTDKILSLQKDLDKLKSDCSTYKSRFENIYSKDFLELFNLNALWAELFNESINNDLYESIILATNEFEPKDIIVGQGLIGAKNKEDALNWLKIIKTALIVNLSNSPNNYNMAQRNNYQRENFMQESRDDEYSNQGINNQMNIERSYSEQISNNEDNYSNSNNDYNHREDYNIDESYTKAKKYEDDDDIDDVSNMFSIF